MSKIYIDNGTGFQERSQKELTIVTDLVVFLAKLEPKLLATFKPGFNWDLIQSVLDGHRKSHWDKLYVQ